MKIECTKSEWDYLAPAVAILYHVHPHRIQVKLTDADSIFITSEMRAFAETKALHPGREYTLYSWLRSQYPFVEDWL